MSDTPNCEHTEAQHIDMILDQWPLAAQMAFTALLMATSAKYAYEHWDEFTAEVDFGDTTRALLDKEWFLEHVVAPAVVGGSFLTDLESAGGSISVDVMKL